MASGDKTHLTLQDRILGPQNKAALKNFFTKIFQRCQEFGDEPYYVPFITRRCHVLIELFWEQELQSATSKSMTEKWRTIYEQHFITDNALCAMQEDMATYYRESKTFPHILAVDELLYHGRALNSFLFTLQQDLVSCEYPGNEDSAQAAAMRQAFQERLEIYVFRQSDTSLSFLLGELNGKLKAERCELPVWRSLSLQFAQLVSVSPVANVAYSWAFRVPPDSDIVRDRTTRAAVCQTEHFTKVVTQMQNCRQETFLSFFPNAETPRAVCSVRSKVSEVDGDGLKQHLFIPFIIFDHLSLPRVCALHRRLAEDAGKAALTDLAAFLVRYDRAAGIEPEQEQKNEKYLQWLCTTNDLLLTALLMRRFAAEVLDLHPQDEAWNQFLDLIDWSQIYRNYTAFDVGDDGSRADTATPVALKQIWFWDTAPDALEQYLKFYLEDVPPFAEGLLVGDTSAAPEIGDLSWTSAVVRGVEDAIAHIGYGAERYAYMRYATGIAFSGEALAHWGDNHSLHTLLLLCQKYMAQQNVCATLYQVAAVIVQAMDLGLLGMNPVYDWHPDHNGKRKEDMPKEVYTRQRAGEASLFIYPLRYWAFLPVLEEIASRRTGNDTGADFDLKQFIRQIPDDTVCIQGAAESKQLLFWHLQQFYKGLQSSGQAAADWDFPISDRRQDMETQIRIDSQLQRERAYYHQLFSEM